MTEIDVVPLLEPRDGVPAVVDEALGLARACEALSQGTGPVAVDAERASGYRYGQSAYLVQLRRAGAGTWLIDPASCPDLSDVSKALEGATWVLHAAAQDLPCLAERGMHPHQVFDTELAARLAGLPRVGLGAVVEQLLGLSLAKEHSAVDWSTRPLPEPWLRYAALDVEVLLDLRLAVAKELASQGKTEWAEQEFAAIVATHHRPAPPRPDPWRRTSGTHRLRTSRQLAVLREVWNERDRLARGRDIAPGRILADSALIALASQTPRTDEDVQKLPGLTGLHGRRSAHHWVQAIERAFTLPEEDLPTSNVPHDGPPPARAWSDRDPAAAARLAHVRANVSGLAERLSIPVENLMTPEVVRRILWEKPDDVTSRLVALGARPWQIDLVGPLLHDALSASSHSAPSEP
ncbi:MAG: ribonuclease D [Actinomycetota bacterium]